MSICDRAAQMLWEGKDEVRETQQVRALVLEILLMKIQLSILRLCLYNVAVEHSLAVLVENLLEEGSCSV
jgi:hypothetical protein